VTWRIEGALLAAVLGLAAVLFSRVLETGANYDEGVYLASDDALRAGGELGSDVFASQPPGFYLLLRAATFLPGDSVTASRVLFLLVALAGVAAAWMLGRTLVSPAAGLVAAAALAVAPAYATNAARVAADVPALAFALGGLAVLAVARERESSRLAVLGGALLALAVGVKLLAAGVIVPAIALLMGRYRLAAAAAAGALVAAALTVLPFAGALPDLWDDAVGFHDDARAGSVTANAETVARAFHPRLAWGVVVLAAIAVALLRTRRQRRALPAWLWAAAAAAFLVWHRPLLDHHFALLAAAASVAVGATLGAELDRLRGRVAVVAAAALAFVLAGAAAQQWRAAGRLAGPSEEIDRAARLVQGSTEPGERIATDLPIVAHLAGRTLPGELVDTSAVRFDAGSLRPEDVLEAADEAGVRVVVIGREFRNVPALLAELERRFPEERRVGEISLRERDRAAARAARASARG
jgi:4-amino-4-deoxy-L-arabinose transferase-like glycosyltransferase